MTLALELFPEIINGNHSCGFGRTYNHIKTKLPNGQKVGRFHSYASWLELYQWRIILMNKKFYNALNRSASACTSDLVYEAGWEISLPLSGLRKKYSFETLCKNPELAAEVACGPINDFDYDVAILFSDILFPLELFDLQLSYNPGPTFENYLNPEQVKKKIDDVQVEEHLQFQSEAIKITKNMLPKDKSLVGFIGGPWTIISYGLNLNKRSEVNVPSEEPFIENYYMII